MGLFLAMSGVANASRAAVEDALRAYATEKSGTLEAADAFADPSDALLIADMGGHVTVMYPGEFMQWDEAAQYLSRALSTSVFSLHIHDEDLWMYVLFSKGEQVDQFNPIPDYWNDTVSDAERRAWAGAAAVVAQHWPGVVPEAIREYLHEWDLDVEDSDSRVPHPNNCIAGRLWRRLHRGTYALWVGAGAAPAVVSLTQRQADDQNHDAKVGPSPPWRT